jgi:hypothetical protein
MLGRLVLVGIAVVTLGCDSTMSDPGKAAAPAKVAAPEAFAGSWNSVTKSYEFIRLTVVSKSVEQGALGARLTLSGLAFEGNARIDADSLIASMSVPGSSETNATLIARAKDSNTLSAQLRTATGTPLDLTFVRQ